MLTTSRTTSSTQDWPQSVSSAGLKTIHPMPNSATSSGTTGTAVPTGRSITS
jgi:hypothetical protein